MRKLTRAEELALDFRGNYGQAFWRGYAARKADPRAVNPYASGGYYNAWRAGAIAATLEADRA